MSWLDRLATLNIPTHITTNITTVPVYFGGSKFIKQDILTELANEHSWVDISNITFKRVAQQTNATIENILQYLCEHRCNSKIYKYSSIDFMLMQIVQKYLDASGIQLTTAETTSNTNMDLTTNIRRPHNITIPIIEQMYHECCDYLQESSNEKLVILLDCRLEYFIKYKHSLSEILLHTAACIALMNRRKLYNFIDFIIIIDKNLTTTQYIFKLTGIADSKNIYINDMQIKNHDQSDYLFTLSTDELDKIRFLQNLLLENLHKNDNISYWYDKKLIKKILKNAHKSDIVLDLELC